MNDDFVMSEEEARKALFDINLEYMNNPPEVRKKLYPEYAEKREKIREALRHAKFQKLQESKKEL